MVCHSYRNFLQFEVDSSQRKPLYKTKAPTVFRRGFFGAAIQIRTGDLVLTKDALYQLSHSSVSNRDYYSRKKLICQYLFSFFLHFIFSFCFFEKRRGEKGEKVAFFIGFMPFLCLTVGCSCATMGTVENKTERGNFYVERNYHKKS